MKGEEVQTSARGKFWFSSIYRVCRTYDIVRHRLTLVSRVSKTLELLVSIYFYFHCSFYFSNFFYDLHHLSDPSPILVVWLTQLLLHKTKSIISVVSLHFHYFFLFGLVGFYNSVSLSYKASSSTPSPTSSTVTPNTSANNNNNSGSSSNNNNNNNNNSSNSNNNNIISKAPVIDLSTNAITSTSSSTAFTTSEFHMNNNRNSRSPQQSESSPQTASPQVPSPQGQTLDLSVSRISQRWVSVSCVYLTIVGAVHSTRGGQLSGDF